MSGVGIGGKGRAGADRAVKGLALGQARHRGAEVRTAVDAVPEGEDLAFACDLLGQLDGPFGCLRAGGGQMYALEGMAGGAVEIAVELELIVGVPAFARCDAA